MTPMRETTPSVPSPEASSAPSPEALPEIAVAAVDGRVSGAMAYALRWAVRRPAHLRVVHVLEDPPVPQPLALDVEEMTGPVVECLLAVSARSDVLVVEVADERRRRLDGQVLGALRRDAACLLVEVDASGQAVRASRPVHALLSRPEADDAQPWDVPVVVAGVDASSDEDGEVVEWAAAEARRTGATLRVVAACSEDGEGTSAVHEMVEHLARRAADVPRVIVVEVGRPVTTLVQNSRDAALLVVGRHRHASPVHGGPAGVDESCARLADCPVVVVPRTVRRRHSDRCRPAGSSAALGEFLDAEVTSAALGSLL